MLVRHHAWFSLLEGSLYNYKNNQYVREYIYTYTNYMTCIDNYSVFLIIIWSRTMSHTFTV